MLHSTYKPVTSQTPQPLPQGWTEHKAPSGHSYYYNAETQQSTYTRPALQPHLEVSLLQNESSQSFMQYKSIGQIPKNYPVSEKLQSYNTHITSHSKEKKTPADKPKSRHTIPGFENWVLVYTKLDRRFVYNIEKNQSYWRVPERLKDAILALDQARIREKANLESKNPLDQKLTVIPKNQPTDVSKENLASEAESSDDLEEEVTDDEDNPSSPKDMNSEIPAPAAPVEFNENDIAYQLASMGEEYGLEQDEYGIDVGGVNQKHVTDEDSANLFRDLLDDFGINPYSPWEKLVDEGKLINDIRYTALTNMKSRKKAWEDWSRTKIKQLQEARLGHERKDPRIPFLSFIQKHATSKLYWPEFKRKYRKEAEIRDTSMTDKEREKIYREHINRMKLTQSKLKSDLLSLLKEESLFSLHKRTLPSNLPPKILSDLRYISLDPTIRDPLIETYISSLPSPPENANE
ncbi:BgTH12-06230 [Blumeria graminis f. sp. triticale]|uniref:BgTH12-06230 n=1 Tax=Blumeria graminis f. sp. triticale TaxID=1689686 RepID=A0A9W4D3B1_BLUGR|nr:BgTH12-06230 [Blumeria graminis f. sp. triticale]